MIVPHYSMLKALNGITVISGVAVYAVDPTVMVAAIMASASILSTLATLTFGFLIRRDNRELKISQDVIAKNVDGKLTKLLDEKASQASELINTKEKLAKTEGRLEGTTPPIAAAVPSDAGQLQDLLERVSKMEKRRR